MQGDPPQSLCTRPPTPGPVEATCGGAQEKDLAKAFLPICLERPDKFVKLSKEQHPLEGVIKQIDGPQLQSIWSGVLEQGTRIHISNTFSGAVDVAGPGTTLRTTAPGYPKKGKCKPSESRQEKWRSLCLWALPPLKSVPYFATETIFLSMPLALLPVPCLQNKVQTPQPSLYWSSPNCVPGTVLNPLHIISSFNPQNSMQ